MDKNCTDWTKPKLSLDRLIVASNVAQGCEPQLDVGICSKSVALHSERVDTQAREFEAESTKLTLN